MLAEILERDIEEERQEMIREVLREVLVVLWDGDPRRQAIDPLCQKINLILEEN